MSKSKEAVDKSGFYLEMNTTSVSLKYRDKVVEGHVGNSKSIKEWISSRVAVYSKEGIDLPLEGDFRLRALIAKEDKEAK